jgi:hypothetical protein
MDRRPNGRFASDMRLSRFAPATLSSLSDEITVVAVIPPIVVAKPATGFLRAQSLAFRTPPAGVFFRLKALVAGDQHEASALAGTAFHPTRPVTRLALWCGGLPLRSFCHCLVGSLHLDVSWMTLSARWLVTNATYLGSLSWS